MNSQIISKKSISDGEGCFKTVILMIWDLLTLKSWMNEEQLADFAIGLKNAMDAQFKITATDIGDILH